MADYTSMSNAIRTILYKKEKSAADTPELPDEEKIVDPNPVDSTDAVDASDVMHARMLTKRRVHVRGDNPVKQQLVRNIRAQQKQKIIDND